MKEHERMLIERIRALSAPLAPAPTGLELRLPVLSGIRAVLFDVYGTLLISASGDIGVHAATHQAHCLAEALQAAGLRLQAPPDDVTAPLAAAIQRSHARSRADGVEWPEVDIRQIWREVLEEWRLEGPVEQLAIEYECRVNPVWPMPGAQEALEALQASGRVLGVISNAQFMTPLLFPALMGRGLEALGFDDALNVWSYQEGQAKPSVALYEKAARALQANHSLTPEQVLYIGNDLRNDIRPAQQAGFRTALFAGDARSLRLRRDDPACRDVEPSAVLTHWRQLDAVLGAH